MRGLLRRLRYLLRWRLRECGCGDVRPVEEFCLVCGNCEMGCCMCEFNEAETVNG